jgi:23S rRNA (adenine2503-C2)-methyltransferase
MTRPPVPFDPIPAGDARSTRDRAPELLHPLARLPEEWGALFEQQGEKSFRGRQVFRWIHARGVLDPKEMTDLPRSLREAVAASGLSDPATVVHVHRAQDRTRKLVLELAEAARVECVLIPMTDLASEEDADASAAEEEDDVADTSLGDSAPGASAEVPPTRVTLCISTQHGCAMGCVFCASGRLGLVRGLGAAEVVNQVLLAKRYLEPGEALRNLVFMGMGEPLHHYDETARALRILTHPDGLDLSPRRITVSTVGLVPGIRRLGEDFGGKVGLAISLHAPDDETRSRIVPMNKRYPLAELMGALKAYPLPKRRRITIEYTLIDGINDSREHAKKLAQLLRPVKVKVNLIPMNSVANSPYQASPLERVTAFREFLAGAGYSCFVRTRRGDDVSAACGQLAMQARTDGREPNGAAVRLGLRRGDNS